MRTSSKHMFRKIRQHTLATSYLFYVVLHAIICAEIWLRLQSPASGAASPQPQYVELVAQ